MAETTTKLWRAPSGRLHQLRGCSGAPASITLTKVALTDAELLAVPVGTLCRCAWSTFEKARERSGQ